MTKLNIRRTSIILGLLIMLALVLVPGSVIKAAEKGSVTIQYAKIKDVEFRIYKVGVMDGHDGYDLIDEFASYNVNLFDDKAAETLAGYVILDKVVPQDVSYTDEAGIARFDNLEIGAYLILGDSAEVETDAETWFYTPQPILLSVPTNVDGERTFDITVNNKFSETNEKKAKYTVQKVWASDEESKRPESIVVVIMKDDEAWKEVTLDAECNWTYSWKVKGEDVKAKWDVVEKEVSEGYLVAVEQVDGTFVITNTGKTPHNPPDNPPKERIPQTGQVWWPILMMIAGGLFLLLIGVLLVRKKN